MEIGFFGTGLMGQAMASRLVASNISLIAYNRTPEKLSALSQAGIKTTTSSTVAIKASQCLILMLTNYQAIESVLLTVENSPLLSGRTIIQMGTIAPRESKHLSDRFSSLGAEYLEAPVLGSIPEAKNGELLVMVGSTPEQFNKWEAILKHFSQQPRLIGSVGKAAALKLALNQLIAGLTTTFALSLALCESFEVETEQFMEILRASALYASTFDKKLSRMLDKNYASPNFPTKHLLKDVELFLSEAQEMSLNTSSLEGIQKIVQKAITQGNADEDYSAIFSAISPD